MKLKSVWRSRRIMSVGSSVFASSRGEGRAFENWVLMVMTGACDSLPWRCAG